MRHVPDPGELDVTHVRDDRPTCGSPFCEHRVPYRGELCRSCQVAIETERQRLRNTKILTQATDRLMRDR